MDDLACILFGIFVLVSVVQSLLVVGISAALWRGKQRRIDDPDCPKAAVVLCLRGVDPYLEDCVQALLTQDYPHYEVCIVIDSRNDPAWPVIERILETRNTGNVHVQALTKRHETCSLKCSSIAQVIASLDESFEIVAQLDADTIPHSTWLRELAAPLADESVGATTGNRWYMPAAADIGSIVRYTWNAAAIVQMFWYQIAWGGTLALKLKVIREANLLERWTHAFCEDTMLYRELRKIKQRVVFVPSLMMVNRESCDLRGFLVWMRRQLVTARLYHPRWIAVAGHCLGTFLLILMAIAIAAVAAFQEQWRALSWVVSGLACYFVSMVLLLPPMEIAVRQIVKSRGEESRWLTSGKVAMFLLTVPFVQAIYPLTLLSALFLRRVSWRGVEYEVSRSGKVRMIEYKPFALEPQHGEHSL